MNISGRFFQIIRCYTTFFCLLAVVPQTVAIAQSNPSGLSLASIARTVRVQLSQRKGYQTGDLLCRDDLDRVLKALADLGWQPPDQKELIRDVLATNDPVVQLLSSRKGVRFMRKVQQEPLIYDRMERVSRVSGGQRMLKDIIALPDGEKYARLVRPNGVPGFLDLLPKSSSGKVRSIKDYKKPTGRIYNEQQLLERLAGSYRNGS